MDFKLFISSPQLIDREWRWANHDEEWTRVHRETVGGALCAFLNIDLGRILAKKKATVDSVESVNVCPIDPPLPRPVTGTGDKDMWDHMNANGGWVAANSESATPSHYTYSLMFPWFAEKEKGLSATCCFVVRVGQLKQIRIQSIGLSETIHIR